MADSAPGVPVNVVIRQMLALFWISVAAIIYAHFGYPVVLLLWPSRRKALRSPIHPPISFVIAARNERGRIAEKIRHLLSLPYAGSRQIVVVSDGSDDGTAEELEAWNGREGVTALHYPGAKGKAFAINQAMPLATGEIVVYNDARQRLAEDALPTLLENFADPSVGCASGELHFETEHKPGLEATLYWKYERWVRERESRIGSCMGATGAFYAIRRDLFRPLPHGLVLDDVFTPLQIALRGWRVLHDSRAVFWDVEAKTSSHEFRRKVRTLGGNYQLLRYLPKLLAPTRIGVQFFSHKIIRLLVPVFLVTALVSNCFLAGAFYRATLFLQIAFYLLALLAWLVPSALPKPLRIPKGFVLLNAAALVAMFQFLRGREVTWR